MYVECTVYKLTIMKKLFNIIIIFFIFSSNVFAADEIEKGKTLLKSLSKKSLTKKETISFLKEYAVIVEDERGDGKVTYIFDDDKYSRYKGTEIISSDAWRFSKLGALRLFNKDVKMTWKIKISDKENLINIKTKFDPVGKLYEFEVKTKKEFLDQIEQIKQAEIQKKEAIEKAKIEKKKKIKQEKLAEEQKRKEEERKLEEEKKKLEEERLAAEQKLEEEKRKLKEERLAAEQKLEEEKRKLEEEKLALQKELEELKKKKAEELEQSEKTPVQLKKEERDKKKKEKLIAQKKAKEEKERLKQEKLAAQKKAKEEKERLKQEKLAAQKKAKEEKRKEEMRNRDDTSNSKLAKKLLKYQNPGCGNYTFKELFGHRLINRKWTDVQHKNYMNKKLVQLEAFDTKLNENISVVFEADYNGQIGRWEVFGDPLLNNFSIVAMDVMLSKCL